MSRFLLRWFVFGILLFTILLTLTLSLGAQIDGARLAFISNRDGNNEIYFADVQRQLSVNMTHNIGTDRQPAFSVDGEWMVYFSQSSEGFYALMNLNTLSIIDLPRVGSENSQTVPRWMPDESIIYFADYQSDTTYFDPVTGETTSGEVNYSSIVADTQDLQQGVLLDEPTPFDPVRGVTVDKDGIPRLVLVDAFVRFERDSGVSLPPFALSYDEEFFAVALPDANGDFDLHRVPVWEGEPINLTRHPAIYNRPTWSHDGRYIAFVSNRDGNFEVYVYDFVTDTTTNISRHPATDGDPVWIP
ncbi:MAG: hypothetical protein RLP44_17355 [Aggregatilineales bacterium]